MKNEYTVTQKVYQSWGRENHTKGVYLTFTIMWSVLAAVLLCLNVYAGWNAFGILMLLFCLYRAFLRNDVLVRGQYKRLSQTYGTTDWTRSIDFGEDGITLSDGNMSVRYAYKDITGFREQDNKIWLDASNKTVIRMYKDCFVDTDYETWKNWMKEHGCGALSATESVPD